MAHEYRPAPMSLAQRAALRSQAPRTLRQPTRRRIYPIVIVIVLLAVLVVAVGGFEYYYRDRIYPRVYLTTANLNLGGMTQDAAVAQLLPFSIRQRLRIIALIAPGQPPILRNATALGYRIDRGRTVWQAYSVGRDGSLLNKAKAQATVLVKGTDVDVLQSVDQLALRNYLFRLAPSVNRRPGPGRAGRQLDVARAQQQIVSGLLGVGAFKVYLPFTTIRALPVPQYHKHTITRHRVKAKR